MRVTPLLLSLFLFIGGSAQTPPPAPPPAWKCPGNLVKNAGFNQHTVLMNDGSMPGSTTDFWTRAYGSPQLQGGDGCHDLDYVSFWGTATTGEAIQQPVNFVANHTYAVSFCARFNPPPNAQTAPASRSHGRQTTAARFKSPRT